MKICKKKRMYGQIRSGCWIISISLKNRLKAMYRDLKKSDYSLFADAQVRVPLGTNPDLCGGRKARQSGSLAISAPGG